MKLRKLFVLIVAIALITTIGIQQITAQTAPTQKSFVAANNLKITVKEIAPYNQATDLQIICYFKHKPSGDTVLTAVADLDKKLGGIIQTLRNSGRFIGEERETIAFIPPANTVQPKLMLLVGLGDEQSLSLDTLRRIGTTALREAQKLGATRISYASALRDQGVSKLDTGDVAQAVVESVILAYDTEKQLQKKGLAKPYTISEWTMEAGADYYADTVVKVQQGIQRSTVQVAARPPLR